MGMQAVDLAIQNGVKRSNKGLKNPLVLFFYPKDDTPGLHYRSLRI